MMLGAAADGGLLAERDRARSLFALREAAIAALREARECACRRAMREPERYEDWRETIVALRAASVAIGDLDAVIAARDCTPEQSAIALASAVVAFDAWFDAKGGA